MEYLHAGLLQPCYATGARYAVDSTTDPMTFAMDDAIDGSTDGPVPPSDAQRIVAARGFL